MDNLQTLKRNQTGREGEDLACVFLEEKGFEIIKRNYRYKRLGEIDVIIRKGNLIIFIEVKSRNSSIYGGALYSINKRKKRIIKKIALEFLTSHPDLYSKDYIYRFDLISILDGKIEWVEDIIR